MSAMICVQYGPITIAVRSTPHTPTSGPLATVCHLEAVADVLDVTVRNDGKDHGRGRVTDGGKVLADLLDRPRRAVHARSLGDERFGPPGGARLGRRVVRDAVVPIQAADR